jgi:TonB family protein
MRFGESSTPLRPRYEAAYLSAPGGLCYNDSGGHMVLSKNKTKTCAFVLSVSFHLAGLVFLIWLGTIGPSQTDEARREEPIALRFYRVRPGSAGEDLKFLAPAASMRGSRTEPPAGRSGALTVPSPPEETPRPEEKTVGRAEGEGGKVPSVKRAEPETRIAERVPEREAPGAESVSPVPAIKPSPEAGAAGESSSGSGGEKGKLRFSVGAIDRAISGRPSERRREGARGGSGGVTQIGPITFDSDEIDFTPYAERLYMIVKRNWYNAIEGSAAASVFGNKGRVRLKFRILQDGRVADLTLVLSSGQYALDRAAMASIERSDPFPPLPADYPREDVGVTFTYYYNLGINEE